MEANGPAADLSRWSFVGLGDMVSEGREGQWEASLPLLKLDKREIHWARPLPAADKL